MTYEESRILLSKRLSRTRYEHSLGVADTAGKLARRFGVDEEKARLDILIFDEIDTGISGRTAQVVGQKLFNISKKHQVIVITHLPQIAAMGDNHIKLIKSQEKNKTYHTQRIFYFFKRWGQIGRAHV